MLFSVAELRLVRGCAPACVTIRNRDGRPFVHVTMAATVFEAVANGIAWFNAPYWHGPKPRRDTVYEVDVVGDGRRWKVRRCSSGFRSEIVPATTSTLDP